MNLSTLKSKGFNVPMELFYHQLLARASDNKKQRQILHTDKFWTQIAKSADGLKM